MEDLKFAEFSAAATVELEEAPESDKDEAGVSEEPSPPGPVYKRLANGQLVPE